MGTLLVEKTVECFRKNPSNGTFKPGEKFCPSLFDSIMCWPASKVGSLVSLPCPKYHDFQTNLRENATKKCEENGQWFVNKQINRTWTNYSRCWNLVDPETALVDIGRRVENYTLFQAWFPTIKTISHIGYTVSLTTLIVAMMIFLLIRRLQCARNRLHMHLFASFIIRGFMLLLKDYLFTQGVAFESDVVFVNGKLQYIKEHYNWACKAITSTWHYSIIANYMLILMEGVYLQNLIFSKIFLDNSSIAIYSVLGWGLPCVFTIPWIILRIYYDDTMCWTISDRKPFILLLHVPIAVSTLINFVLFVMIIYVLFVKLNTMNIQQRKTKYKRLVCSTLILVPLFGVPYVLSLIVSYLSSIDERLEVIWLLCDQTYTSLQGFFVATIYCLLNREVRIELKQRYYHLKNNFAFNQRRINSFNQQFPISTLSAHEDGFNGVLKVTNSRSEYLHF